MPKTDVEQERIIGTFVGPTNNLLLGDDEIYQDEVTVPLVEKADRVIPDLEFMLRHDEGNYHSPLVEQRGDSLIAVGNNGYLEAHRNVGTNLVHFHLTRPLNGSDSSSAEEVKRLFGAYGPVGRSPDQEKARSTFLFFEDRTKFQSADTISFLQEAIDGFASEVTGKPRAQIFIPYRPQGAVNISNDYGPLDIGAQTKLMQGLPGLYAELEKKFGPIRSINGEKKDS